VPLGGRREIHTFHWLAVSHCSALPFYRASGWSNVLQW